MISLFVFLFLICFPDLQWKLWSELSRKTDLVQCICCQILAFCCWVFTRWSLFTSRSLRHTKEQRFDILQKLFSFQGIQFFTQLWNLPSHHWYDLFFFFATTLALEPLSCSFFLKNLVKIQSLQVIHCICLSPCSLPLTTFCRKEVFNFTAKIPYWSSLCRFVSGT